MYIHDSIRSQSIHTQEHEVKVGLLSQPTDNTSAEPAKKKNNGQISCESLRLSLIIPFSQPRAGRSGRLTSSADLVVIQHERVHGTYPSGPHHGAQLVPSNPIYQNMTTKMIYQSIRESMFKVLCLSEYL